MEKKKLSLPAQIFIALLLGIVVGLAFYFMGKPEIDRLPSEYKAASQMQRAWDYPKIATCPGQRLCLLFSQISVSPSPRFFWQSERDIPTFVWVGREKAGS